MTGASNTQERAHLSEPLAAQAVVRYRLQDDGPVLGRVVANAEMSQFVGDHVVDERRRRHDGAPVEAERAVRTTPARST